MKLPEGILRYREYNFLKMMKKLLIILAACLLLSGCSEMPSMENLLTPPKMSAEQNELYQTLINSAGQDVKLKYPKSGDYRSAFVIRDIDNDGIDEALVFYESKNVQSGENALRLKFLDKSSGKWQAVYDLACLGSEVDSISFANLGSFERTDIIICYTLLGQTEKVFSVLNYADNMPVELFSSSYSIIEVTDLNMDGEDELVAVTLDKVSQTYVAMMFKSGADGFEKLSETALYGGAADYLRVTKGRISEQTEALFLDYSKGGGQSGTDVIYCYGSKLFCPDSVGQNSSSGIISRLINDYMAEIYCADIDLDGLTEIPSTVPLPGYETLSRSEQLCAVQWYKIENDRYIPEHYSYYSSKYRFALLFPNRWQGVVSAIPDIDNNDIVFISYSVSTGLEISSDTELMRIRTIDKDDLGAVEPTGDMKLLAETDEMCYYLIETASYKNGSLALTESELQYNFIVL